MKLTVLGYQSPYPGPGGATPGYLVETDQGKVLLDCGSGVVSQLGHFVNPWELDGVVLSHLHHDHITDMPILQYAMMMAEASGKRNKPLKVYAPDEPRDLNKRLTYKQYIDLHPLFEDIHCSLAGIQFSFLRTDHGVPCYAMKLEYKGKTLVYGADSGPGTAWNPFARQADLFICESTYLERNRPDGKRGHLTAAEAARYAAELDCRNLMLTHLYPEYRHDEVLQEAAPYFRGGILIADIGLQVEL
ncbi:MAG: MBL fold metallo-hydrolase [Bacillaceae bacterium]|nr:MBL fold metallo-hydrolase [Bacillaceae bacterium]